MLKLLERCKNISVEDYDRMRDDVQQMQVICIYLTVKDDTEICILFACAFSCY